jgi:Flp pilus assembly protein CpaB
LNPRVRNGIIIAILGIGLVLVGIFTLTSIIQRSLAPLPVADQPTPVLEQVVVVTRDIALGTLLTSGDVTLMDVPVEVAPRNSLNDVELAVGRVTKTQLIAGEMVLTHNLADPTNINHDLAYVLAPDKILMAFQPSDLMTNLGIIQRGDIIDILVTVSKEVPISPDEAEQILVEDEDNTTTETFTFDAFQLVEVTAMVVEIITSDQNQQQGPTTFTSVGGEEEAPPTPVPSTQDIRVEAYLLAIDPQDALVLKHFQDTGAIFDLVIRSPNSTQLFDLLPVTEDFLVDRYQLEANR